MVENVRCGLRILVLTNALVMAQNALGTEPKSRGDGDPAQRNHVQEISYLPRRCLAKARGDGARQFGQLIGKIEEWQLGSPHSDPASVFSESMRFASDNPYVLATNVTFVNVFAIGLVDRRTRNLRRPKLFGSFEEANAYAAISLPHMDKIWVSGLYDGKRHEIRIYRTATYAKTIVFPYRNRIAKLDHVARTLQIIAHEGAHEAGFEHDDRCLDVLESKAVEYLERYQRAQSVSSPIEPVNADVVPIRHKSSHNAQISESTTISRRSKDHVKNQMMGIVPTSRSVTSAPCVAESILRAA